jgi:hypothetical protein
MKKNYVSRIILNFTKDVCGYPGDICIYDYTSKMLTVYRGGELMYTTDEISPNGIKSMIDLKWLVDSKVATQPIEVPGVNEEEIISLNMEIAPAPGAEKIEVAPTVEVVEWEEDEVIPMDAIEQSPDIDIEIPASAEIEVAPLLKVDAPAEEVDGDEDVEVIAIEREEGVGASDDAMGGGDTDVISIEAEPEVVKSKKTTKKR